MGCKLQTYNRGQNCHAARSLISLVMCIVWWSSLAVILQHALLSMHVLSICTSAHRCSKEHLGNWLIYVLKGWQVLF